jgi:hypothetical protein
MPTDDEPSGNPAEAAPTVPAGVSLAWDAAITVALAGYFFFVQSFARGLLGDLGLSPAVAIKSVLVMGVLAGFILWVAPITDLPRIVWRHRLPERRLAHGECPRCGQPQAPAASLASDCFPLPPIPTSRACPRGCDSTRATRDTCPAA